MMSDPPRRQVAYKMRIADLLNGEYIKREGWQPSAVLLGDREVSRVNIVATVVAKPEGYLALIDDGTARIALRSFEARDYHIDVGDVVLVIARPREFNNERYLMPEIVRRIENPKWIELRSLELGNHTEPSGDNIEPAKSQDTTSPAESFVSKVCGLLRKLDTGSGADYQEIVQTLGAQAEATIESLLKSGEIFEIRPGWLKVLD